MKMLQPYTIFPLGDSALLVDFGDTLQEDTSNKVLALFQRFQQLSLPYIIDIVPAYTSLAIHYHLARIPQSRHYQTAFEWVAHRVRVELANTEILTTPQSNRLIKVPVCYAEKYAWDLQKIADDKALTKEEIIRLHTQKTYKVYLIGFLPGFAYMGTVDAQIAVPRKTVPRMQVEAGSVGIAGTQTGIYSLASPGGWQIIGKTPATLFNKDAPNPILFQPGDEVLFFSINEDEFQNYQSRHS